MTTTTHKPTNLNDMTVEELLRPRTKTIYLAWYEDRAYTDMPEYIKFRSTTQQYVFKISEWYFTNDCWYFKSSDTLDKPYSIPELLEDYTDILPATLAEYTNYLTAKPN